MRNMKLIMENWNSYVNEENQNLTEEDLHEVEQVYQELMQSTINEGLITAGSRLWNATKSKLKQFKDWGEEKLTALVKKIGGGLIKFFQGLRQKGVWKKYKTRTEVNAVKMLMTKKHIPLATMIFTALLKLTGGLAIDLVVKSEEIMETISSLFEKLAGGKTKEALSMLFGSGDSIEALQMVKKFMDFSKDVKSMAGKTGSWNKFGGMAEIAKI